MAKKTQGGSKGNSDHSYLVRFKSDFKTRLNEAMQKDVLEGLKISKNELFVRSVEWVLSLPYEQRQAIGKGTKPSSLYEDVCAHIHNLAWADHAFRAAQSASFGGMFSSWSIQAYELVRRKSPNKKGRDFGTYRQAYSWACQARSLRRTATKLISDGTVKAEELEEWQKLYRTADNCIRAAMAHNRTLLETMQQPVFKYNLSCEYSMRSQFLIESYLPKVVAANSTGKQWAKWHLRAIHTPTDGETLCTKDKKEQMFISKVGSLVEGLVKEKRWLPEKIIDLADKWLIESERRLQESAMLNPEWEDMSFLKNYALEDPDLALLWEYPVTRNRLSEWMPNPNISPVDICTKLLARIEGDIRKSLEEIEELPTY
jgi:hypothetical protein